MIFRQITHDDLGCASYLVADETTRVAAVIDPVFDIRRYLRLVAYMELRIEHVFETHTHADHLSGHGRLLATADATIHIHRDAQPLYPCEPIEDGQEYRLGHLVVRAMHTPGHRPEHSAFVLVDTRRSDDPWVVLTGDTLLVGDVARPDLALAAADGASGLFRSLNDKLLALPDDVEVWPGHLGGSMCGGSNMDSKISSTIGFERRHNPWLQIGDEQTFVTQSLSSLGPRPPNFRRIVELNNGPPVTHEPELSPLRPGDIDDRTASTLIVDLRPETEFACGHVPGAVCVPLSRRGFGTKVAWLFDQHTDLVFVGDDHDDPYVANRLAAAVGIGGRTYFLRGGMASWQAEHRRIRRIEPLKLRDLLPRLRADPTIQIVDVRERGESDNGHIPGSVTLPWHEIQSMPADIDPGRPVAVICASGQRAAIAASLLQRCGVENVVYVTGGGVPDWARLGYPLTARPR